MTEEYKTYCGLCDSRMTEVETSNNYRCHICGVDIDPVHTYRKVVNPIYRQIEFGFMVRGEEDDRT